MSASEAADLATSNPVEPFLRMDRMPHIWCPGCGIGTTVNCFTRALIDSKADLDKLVRRLQTKIRDAADRITLLEEDGIAGADVVVVSYGITSRVAQRAIELARAQGLKIGKLRLITCWPFPEERVRAIAQSVKAFVVPELNLGQMVREVERVAGRHARTYAVPHAGGSVHHPEDILKTIVEASR